MSIIEKLASAIPGQEAAEPAGTIKVVDPHPFNWLYITYNTVEELVRVEPSGSPAPAAMTEYKWLNDRTLEVEIRSGEHFTDGELLTAASVKRAIDEAMKWKAPHPPGTHFNINLARPCEITGDHTIQLHLAEPDGFAVGKLRALHIMSTRFWEEAGFGYKRNGTGEGHW